MAEANMFRDGGAYEQLMGRWSRVAGDLFLDWLSPAQGLRWIDVGCGNGAFTTRVMARAAPVAVLGVDPSEAQIAHARRRPELASARFEVAEAAALPCEDRAFDVAVMALVLAFVPDPPRGLAEVVRAVAPGGTVAAYMWDLPNQGTPTAPIGAAMRAMGLTPNTPPSPGASSLAAMRDLWPRAGLVDVETTTLRVPVRFEGFDEFWNSNTLAVGPTGSSVAALSDEDRARLREAVRARLTPGPDGAIAYEAVANAVRGTVARG